MARKSRTSVLKRQREAQKRERERRKAEKAEMKRARRHGKPRGTKMASRDDLVGLGILPPPLDDAEDENESED